MEEAESNPTRRLRRLPAPARRVLAVVVPLVALGLLATPLAANGLAAAVAPIGTAVDPAAAVAAESTASTAVDEPIEVRIAPRGGTTIDPAAATTLEVEIVNRTGEALPAGTVRLTVPTEALDAQPALDAWLADDPAASDDAAASDEASDGDTDGDADDALPTPPSTVVAETEVRPLAVGSASVSVVPVPGDALAPQAGAAVVGFGAEFVIDGRVVATGDAAFASTQAPSAREVALTIVAPITIPPQAGGVADADQLANWTGPTGLLTRQLDALADRPVAIAVDPRIIVSIRVLGSTAPPSATAWLERLAAVSNEVFPLAYGDSDLALQAQLGVGVLQPTSFVDALDPAAFTTDDGTGAGEADADAPQDGDGDGAATTPPAQPTPPADLLPTTEDLLSWPYTRTDIAWPAADTVATGNLAVFRGAGLATSILAAGNVEASALEANAASIVDGESVLVSDGRVTDALAAAAAASSETAEREASGRALAELAMRASTPGDAVTLLATLPRGAGTSALYVTTVLDRLGATPWSHPASLSDAVGAPPTQRTLIDLPESEQRRSWAQRLIDAEASLVQFATVLDDPRLLTGPARRQLLSLLDVAWIADQAGWGDAVGTWLVDQRATTSAVSVVPSSSVLIVASETGVPTTIENALPYPATVFVDVEPSNGRLVVDDRVEVTLAPQSRSNVQVPVEAGVGNGDVVLTVRLQSPEGVPVGQPVEIPATVHADWEGLGAAILATIVVLFFGVGIWRAIRRRRRDRAEAEAEAEAEASASDSAEVSDSAEDATDVSGQTDAPGEPHPAPSAPSAPSDPASPSKGSDA